MVEIKHHIVSEIPVLELFEKDKENLKLPTVFFYHGWESRKERVLEQGYFLAKNGFRAVLPEAKFHGERKNDSLEKHKPIEFWDVVLNSVKNFPDLVEYYIANKLLDKNTIRVAGLSMGGITANALLTQYSWIHSAAVLMGSPSPIEYSKWLLTNYKVNGTPISDTLNPKTLERKLQELEFISIDLQPEIIKNRPVYIWHGTEDSTVPIHLTENFIHDIKGKDYSQKVIFEKTDGVEHEVPQEIIIRMVDFFKDYSTK